MIELPPVGGDHVRGHLELRGILEFPHDLAARISRFGTAGILHVGDDPMHVLAELDGLF